eukprot:361556-Chlamydomonas_euryale.AAC.3
MESQIVATASSTSYRCAEKEYACLYAGIGNRCLWVSTGRMSDRCGMSTLQACKEAHGPDACLVQRQATNDRLTF